jgi:hypothetical protein
LVFLKGPKQVEAVFSISKAEKHIGWEDPEYEAYD